MDGISGSHGRRLALACACVLAFAFFAPAHGAVARTTNGPMLGAVPAGHARPQAGFSATNAVQGSGQLTWHGGPVMHSNRVYAIYWVPSGYSISANYRSIIDGFFTNVAADSGKTTNVYATDAEYGDGSGSGAYNTTFAGSTLDTQVFPANGCTNAPFSTCLTGAQLANEISRVALAQGWTRNATTLFFMFTPRNVGSCFDASGSECFASQYCAYHSWRSDSNGLLLYANMPYNASSSGCGQGWLAEPNNDDADLTINVTSHEHNEAVTDPQLNAWYDAAGYEDGDKCAWDFGTAVGGSGMTAYNEVIGSGHYMTQREYSNASSSCVQTEPSAPSNTAVPTIGGTTTVGQMLTVSPGSWAGSPTSYQYTWRRCTPTCAAIPGATTSTYTLTVADAGATIQVLVWAVNAAGHGAATSAQTATVSAGSVPTNTVAPTVSGTLSVAQTLTVGPGTWTGSPTSYQYTWRRCTPTCVGIAGAYTSSYTLTAADAGATMQVLVWAINAAGHGAATTAQTATVH